MAMTLFTRRDDNGDKALLAAQGRRDSIANRLRGAEASVTSARDAVAALAARDADDSALDTALATKRAAEDKANALASALVTANGEVAELQAQVDAVADKKLRVETSGATLQINDDVQAAGVVLIEAANDLYRKCHRAADLVLDAGPLAGFAANISRETPAALDMIGQVLRHRAEQVMLGQVPAALPMPEAERAPPRLALVAPPPVERVFAMKHLRFTDAAGNQRRICKMNSIDLPAQHAKLALQRGWAIPIDDKRVRGLSGAYGSQIPILSWCIDLDNPDGEAPDTDADTNPAVTTQPRAFGFGAFETPVIGPAKPARYQPLPPAEPVPMAATRSAPTADDEG
jgi:hypothetical protein